MIPSSLDVPGEKTTMRFSRRLPHAAIAQILVFASMAVVAESQTFSGVLTWHNDNARTGQNLSETVLTPQNVNSNSFGKVLSYPVDGQIYTQPLYVPNLNIPGKGIHNVVYIATENDSVYAFDADGKTGIPLWKTSFANPVAGITPVNCTTAATSCSVYPVDGITATPVIDPLTNTIYVVAHTFESGSYYVRLHALNIATGAEKFGGPVALQATVNGTGVGSVHGKITMGLQGNLARPALLLLNGVVYIALGGNPHAWILAYDAQTLAQLAVFSSSPNGTLGGIWQSGAGLAADTEGHIYASTGDGTFDASTGGVDYGDTILKLDGSLNVLDYFTPMDQACRFTDDMDLSAGGPMLLPPQSGAVANEVLISGKGGSPCDAGASPIYVVNRDSLGGYDPAQDHVVQEIAGSPAGYWSNPAFWHGPTSEYVYFAGKAAWTTGDRVKMYSLTDGQLSTTYIKQSANVPINGGTPSVSSNGTSSGILWLLSRQEKLSARPGVMPAALYAYDATDVSKMLYSSVFAGKRDQPGCGNKFQVPTIANGKVFVATQNELDIYGLLNQPLPAYPVLLSSPCLDFSNVIVGQSSAAQTVILKNGGTTTLKVNSIAVGGLSAHDFTQTNNCTSVLPNGSCTITVTFKPSAINPRYATITIADSALTQQSIFIIGNGTPADSLLPASLTFPTTKVGTSSTPQTVTLKNLDLVNTLSVTNISLTGTHFSDFSQTNNCPASVAPGANCTINVTFTPQAIGNRNAQLSVTAGGSVQKVPVTGTGN
jgi:Transmembrane protein 131-like N-terminal/Abnormal spindle-like microcephaly-assoc'd, ASPM-SPD-2-Hydin